MTKTITVNNGEYLSDVLSIVLKHAIRTGIINKEAIVCTKLQIKPNEKGGFDYPLAIIE